MELHIDGRQLSLVDRKLWKRESFEGNGKETSFLSPRFYKPSYPQLSELEESDESVIKSDTMKSSSGKKYSDVLVDNKVKKRKILKRPRRFKNYYTNRKPLTIPCFSFPRFGETLHFRGRQTICKFYKNNEILNNQLIRIKSAATSQDIERIFNEQLRHNQFYSKSEKSIEAYYDTQAVLKTSGSETCLCAKEFYRLDYNLQPWHDTARPKVQSNAIKNLTVDDKCFEDFYRLANECYDTCIQFYLNNLNDCNRKAEAIARQSVKRPATSCGILKRSLKVENKVPDELTIQLKRLSINLEQKSCGGQSSTNICSSQAMSCNDTNNNSTESTNLKEPPKIIFSDFSTKQQQTEHASQELQANGDSEKSFDSDTKNNLTIPLTNYCSEARPP